MPTDIGFTGQRLDATGLMFFQARYLSPVLGRFVSADTIVPEAENPQAFNRYAYTLNNPVKYTNPTGHRITCGEGSDIRGGCSTVDAYGNEYIPGLAQALANQKHQFYARCHQNFEPGCSATAQAVMDVGDGVQSGIRAVGDLLNTAIQTVDKLLNNGFGGQGSFCGGGDISVGVEGCFSGQILLNPRSGQIGFLVTVSAAPKVGTPNGLYGSVSLGPVIAPGVSDLNALMGPGAVQGGDLNLDALVETGLYAQRSESFDDKGQPRIDPVTGMPVTTLSLGGQTGANWGLRCHFHPFYSH